MKYHSHTFHEKWEQVWSVVITLPTSSATHSIRDKCELHVLQQEVLQQTKLTKIKITFKDVGPAAVLGIIKTAQTMAKMVC